MKSRLTAAKVVAEWLRSTSGTDELEASITKAIVDAQVRALQFVRNLTPQSIEQVITDVRSGKAQL